MPALAEEVGRRGGHVPLLRLPFELDDVPEVPGGFDTVVRLPLREDAVASVRRQHGEVGAALMLALQALELVEINVDEDVRELAVERRKRRRGRHQRGLWRTVEAHGEIPGALLQDRPVEERARPFWQVRWALPEGGLPEDVSGVVHAPTPSDERLDLPALLIASFPLAPDRRHVAPGALSEFLVERTADAYVRLLGELPVSPRVLDLVPGPVGVASLTRGCGGGSGSGCPRRPSCRIGRGDGTRSPLTPRRRSSTSSAARPQWSAGCCRRSGVEPGAGRARGPARRTGRRDRRAGRCGPGTGVVAPDI